MINPNELLHKPTDRHDGFERIADASCADMIDSFNSFRHKSDMIRLIGRFQEVIDTMRVLVQQDCEEE